MSEETDTNATRVEPGVAQVPPEAAVPAPATTEAAVPASATAEAIDSGEAPAAADPEQIVIGELPSVSLRDLIDAGVHFGHQTNRWNPKMAPYIYGARNGIHIVDLDQTVQLFQRALGFVAQTVARGGQLLFVGTKRQAQDVIRDEAERAGQFHVTGRWLGGTLTNFRTMKIGIDRLRTLEQMEEDGTMAALTKKEALTLSREKERLIKFVGGIKDMNGPPAALFVVDPNLEHIAVSEANKLHIPVVALTDTNCDPDKISYVIPGNDDAIRSLKLVTMAVADACVHGQSRRREFMQAPRRDGGAGPEIAFSRGRGGRHSNPPGGR
ncbi:MAG: 30S ribosomal protein S2 [Myxococcales bacterium]|jgi:small subunit ribosomal protein S2